LAQNTTKLKSNLTIEKSAPTLYLNGTSAGIDFYNGDVTLQQSSNTLTLGGGNFSLGTNSLLGTGSIGATGIRLLKGWFTDLEITNLPTVNGIAFKTALSLTAADVGLGNVTNESKATMFNNTTLTGTPTVATTINPDANDGATLGQSGTAWSDLFLADDGVINWAAGDVTMARSQSEELTITANVRVTERLILGDIYLEGPTPDVTISNTELAALDGVTGGEVMTTESLTDAVLIPVSDTTVTAAVGKIVFKTSDGHFYGCKATTGKKWYQLDN